MHRLCRWEFHGSRFHRQVLAGGWGEISLRITWTPIGCVEGEKEEGVTAMDEEAVWARVPIGVLRQVAAFCEDPEQRKLVLNKGDREYKWEMCQYGKVTG